VQAFDRKIINKGATEMVKVAMPVNLEARLDKLAPKNFKRSRIAKDAQEIEGLMQAVANCNVCDYRDMESLADWTHSISELLVSYELDLSLNFEASLVKRKASDPWGSSKLAREIEAEEAEDRKAARKAKANAAADTAGLQ
jgi:hypothetical protein